MIQESGVIRPVFWQMDLYHKNKKEVDGIFGEFSPELSITIDTTAPSAITISGQDCIMGRGSLTLTAVNGPLSDAAFQASGQAFSQ